MSDRVLSKIRRVAEASVGDTTDLVDSTEDLTDFGEEKNEEAEDQNPVAADSDQLSTRSMSSITSMSATASDIFKIISPHLPPTKAPAVLRQVSDAFASAQSRISTAEAERDSTQVRLRQSESSRKS